MKRKDFLAEIKVMSKADLKSKASSMSEELMKLRFRKSSGQLQQGHIMRQVKRNLARVMTAIKVANAK